MTKRMVYNIISKLQKMTLVYSVVFETITVSLDKIPAAKNRRFSIYTG